MARRHLMALAAAALVASCGGGNVAEPAATPQAAVDGLRAHILAIGNVSTSEVARQLMDFAESSIYKSFFPGHPATLTFGPFLSRAYSNGVLLGVASGNDRTYPDGVYVMGGPFGNNPLFQGAVTNFITPVEAGGGTTGANNGCYDLALFDTTGTRLVLSYEIIGEATGNTTIDLLVGAVTGFEGNSQARETTTRNTGTTTAGGQSVPVDFTAKNYARRTGDAEVTEYGDTHVTATTVGGISSTTNSKTVWSPPSIDKQYGLAIGGSYTLTQTGTTSSSTVITGLPARNSTTPTTTTETTKYVGRESVTVPAGSYSTCRFESTTAGSPGTSTTWVIVGKGVGVKSVDTNGAGVVTQTLQATSLTLNGAKL